MGQQYRIGTGNTAVMVNGDDLSVILHSTEVVKRVSGVITLKTGGWFTPTTKTRMQQASRQYGLGYNVFQKAGEWFVDWKGVTLPFDGDSITLPA